MRPLFETDFLCWEFIASTLDGRRWSKTSATSGSSCVKIPMMKIAQWIAQDGREGVDIEKWDAAE